MEQCSTEFVIPGFAAASPALEVWRIGWRTCVFFTTAVEGMPEETRAIAPRSGHHLCGENWMHQESNHEPESTRLYRGAGRHCGHFPIVRRGSGQSRGSVRSAGSARTNMTEHDPAVLDVEQWADYWASLKIDAVMVSVTGILAFYQTKVPHHTEEASSWRPGFLRRLLRGRQKARHTRDRPHESDQLGRCGTGPS